MTTSPVHSGLWLRDGVVGSRGRKQCLGLGLNLLTSNCALMVAARVVLSISQVTEGAPLRTILCLDLRSTAVLKSPKLAFVAIKPSEVTRKPATRK